MELVLGVVAVIVVVGFIAYRIKESKNKPTGGNGVTGSASGSSKNTQNQNKK